MDKSRTVSLGVAIIAVAAIAVWMSGWPVQIQAEQMTGHQKHDAKQAAADAMTGLKAVYSHHIPALSSLLNQAKAAIKAEDSQSALEHLQKAEAVIEIVKQAVGQEVLPAIVNTRCPIMGGAINPDKLSDALKREYKGQTVGFCCGGCPAHWDQLSDAAKGEKLSKAKSDVNKPQHKQ